MRILKLHSSVRWQLLRPTALGLRTFSCNIDRRQQWGFIGLGAMGHPMASNLASKISTTDKLTVFDTNATTAKNFIAQNSAMSVELARDAREVAKASDVVLTVLPEPQHVMSVFQHILVSTLPSPPNKSSRLYIDCSTIDPVTSLAAAALVQSSGSESAAHFVDAPMSGGVVGARAGSLTFMVGSDGEVLPEVERTLLLMGKKVCHLGAQGAGVSGKLANNYALAINNIGAAEAMNLGTRWGLDPKALASLINSSTGRSWPSEINNPAPQVVPTAPASQDYQGGFGVSLMRKDLRLAIAAAKEVGARLELAEKAAEVYGKVEKDHKGKDFSVVYRWLGGKE